MMHYHIPVYVFLLTGIVRVTEGAISADLISNLPGLEHPLHFKQYSGYLKATGTRKLHYWFVESSNSPASDPVVLWLNGGPGCSSMDGLLTEHGPFRPDVDGKTLKNNPHSWNKVANILYLEAPAGVGFSYSDDRNYTTDDDQVSLDNYMALKFFFANYPEYSKNDFYITGESYGGIYVPTLSARVVDDSSFNFKGFAVGNGVTDRAMLDNAIVYFGYYHGLWGSEQWSRLVAECCVAGNQSQCDFAHNKNPACTAEVRKATMLIWSTLNVYNLYGECYRPKHRDNRTVIHPRDSFIHSQMYEMQQQFLMARDKSGGSLSGVPPCVDARGATTYLNRADVRTAIHIPSNLPKWEICSGDVEAHYKTIYQTMRPQYLKVLATKKQRILVYNGDVDMACNFLGDQWFVDSLQQQELVPYKTWNYIEKDGSTQIAGFAKQFQNINFVTIKGAGHMVPGDKPIPALDMFTKFIKNQPF